MLCFAVSVSGNARGVGDGAGVATPVSLPIIAIAAFAVKAIGSGRGVGDGAGVATPVSLPVMVIAFALVFTMPAGATLVADCTLAYEVASAAIHEIDAIVKRFICPSTGGNVVSFPAFSKRALAPFDE